MIGRAELRLSPAGARRRHPLAAMATDNPAQVAPVNNVAHREMIRGLIRLAGMLPVLILICVLFSFLTPRFWSVGNGINVVRQASINIVLAAGMTFVILTGGIDLAVGSVLGVTGVISVLASLMPGISWAAVPIALLAGLAVGVATGALVGLRWIGSLHCYARNVYGVARCSLSGR